MSTCFITHITIIGFSRFQEPLSALDAEETLHLYVQKTNVGFWILIGKPLQPTQHFVDDELAIQARILVVWISDINHGRTLTIRSDGTMQGHKTANSVRMLLASSR